MNQRRYEPQYDEHLTNPHLITYNPNYTPVTEKPEYHRYQQPIYHSQRRAAPMKGETHMQDRFRDRPFNYETSGRYHNWEDQHQHVDHHRDHHVDHPRDHHLEQQRSQHYNAHESPRHPQEPMYENHHYHHVHESPRHPQEHHHHLDPGHAGYDVLQPAGRANNYSTRITDLLTSVKEPEHKDLSLQKLAEASKGYLVLMRFRSDDIGVVRTVVKENLGTLNSHHGYVIGVADPRHIQTMVPSHGLVTKARWDKQDYAVCCFWFADVYQAKRWFESAPKIKQPDFPSSNSFQTIATPLTYGMNQRSLPFGPNNDEVTLLWSEYPVIYERHDNDFLMNYSEPTRERMYQFGANPYVSISRYEPGWPKEPNKYGQPEYGGWEGVHPRVARAIRTGWTAPKTYITVSTFPSMRAVEDFFDDPKYMEIRSNLNRYTEPHFTAITLRKWDKPAGYREHAYH